MVAAKLGPSLVLCVHCSSSSSNSNRGGSIGGSSYRLTAGCFPARYRVSVLFVPISGALKSEHIVGHCDVATLLSVSASPAHFHRGVFHRLCIARATFDSLYNCVVCGLATGQRHRRLYQCG